VISGQPALGAQESFRGAARVSGESQQPVGDDQRAGVDEWIAGDAMLVLELNERIERRTRRLASHSGPQRRAVAGDHEGEREHLRDALDGEPLAPFPDAAHIAIDGRDGQAELVRVGVGEHGYLIRDMPAAEHAPNSVGHAVKEASVFEPADRCRLMRGHDDSILPGPRPCRRCAVPWDARGGPRHHQPADTAFLALPAGHRQSADAGHERSALDDGVVYLRNALFRPGPDCTGYQPALKKHRTATTVLRNTPPRSALRADRRQCARVARGGPITFRGHRPRVKMSRGKCARRSGELLK
jgi:hypothetical protein